MATTTTRMLLLLGLSFLGTISVASGYACTYRGQGVSSCALEEVQDVWLESSSRNYNDWEFLLIGKGTGFPLKRSLLQFEDFTTSADCPTVTDAVKAWANGTKDNNGLLMKVLDEDTDGRDLRFYSNGYTEDTTKHPYINVICSSP